MYFFGQGHLELPLLSYKVVRGKPAALAENQGRVPVAQALDRWAQGGVVCCLSAPGPATALWPTVSSLMGMRPRLFTRGCEHQESREKAPSWGSWPVA